MKNYSLDSNKAKEFILNYHVLDNKITINYANGDSKTMAYSPSEEKAILEKMREQVLNSKELLANTKMKFDIFSKLFWDEILLLVMFIISIFSVGIPFMATIIGLGIFIGAIGLTGYKAQQYKKLRDDIRKHWLFLENEGCLNEAIRNNQEVTKKLANNLKGKILSGNKEIPFSLNTIDRLDYRELRQIYEQTDCVVGREKNKARRKKWNRT